MRADRRAASSIHDMETSQRLPDADALESEHLKGSLRYRTCLQRRLISSTARERGVESESYGDMVYYRECADAFLTVVDEGDTKMLNYDLMKDALHPDKPEGTRRSANVFEIFWIHYRRTGSFRRLVAAKSRRWA